MTTKLDIKNNATSNGDAHVTVDGATHTLSPGMAMAAWITTSSKVSIEETWPTPNPSSPYVMMRDLGRSLIQNEVDLQNKMWGESNDRADASEGQLLGGALAQAAAVAYTATVPNRSPEDRAQCFEMAREEFFPDDWGGFRDYGSDIANLVVAAAYIENEIKRRLLAGESYERSKRTVPYEGDQPNKV